MAAPLLLLIGPDLTGPCECPSVADTKDNPRGVCDRNKFFLSKHHLLIHIVNNICIRQTPYRSCSIPIAYFSRYGQWFARSGCA